MTDTEIEKFLKNRAPDLFNLIKHMRKFEPTKGLRAEVMKCCKKLKKQGYKFTRGTYVNPEIDYETNEDGSFKIDKNGNHVTKPKFVEVCALGAISVCAKEAGKDGRGGTQSFALSLKHLGCTPWELESIEAGFEGWDDSEIRQGEGANGMKASSKISEFEPIAYKIGEDIWDQFGGD